MNSITIDVVVYTKTSFGWEAEYAQGSSLSHWLVDRAAWPILDAYHELQQKLKTLEEQIASMKQELQSISPVQRAIGIVP